LGSCRQFGFLTVSISPVSSSAKFLSTLGRFAGEVGTDLIKPSRKLGYLRRWMWLNYTWISRQPSIPSLAPAALIPGLKSMVVPVELRFGMWNVTPLELYYLACLARVANPRTFFEFGTYDGASTWQLAKTCPEAQVYTIDLPQNEGHFKVGSRFLGQPEESRIHSLRGDSTKFDYSPYAGKMDFIFIDGGHDYDVAASDTQSALKMASPDAVILWHDYLTFSGVKRAVDELSQTQPVVHIKGTEFALLRLGKSAQRLASGQGNQTQDRATWLIGESGG
jgi:predicted O-methyltransferase YrrM